MTVRNRHLLLVELDHLRGIRRRLIEARIDFLKDKYVALIVHALETRQISFPRAANPLNAYVMEPATDPERAQRVFDLVTKADPDIHKKNTQWLLNLLLKPSDQGPFLLEDLEKATYYLEIYQRVKGRLQPEARDLNKYKSLPALYAAIEPIEKEMSKREADRAMDAKMHTQATVVYNTPQYKITIPHTKEASCYFGMNTQWCTAASRGSNQFDYYNKQGPLYVILEKATNTRWQFHVATGQFADERDHMIDVKQFAIDHPEAMQALNDHLPRPVAVVGEDELPVFQFPDKLVIKDKNPIVSAGRTLVELTLSDNKFVGHELRKASAADINGETVSYLLNDLHIEGDPEGTTNSDLFDLYYRDGAWMQFYEVAKPILSSKSGWHWDMVNSTTQEHYILYYGEFNPDWEASSRKIGYACEAWVDKMSGQFWVSETPIVPYGNKASTAKADLSKYIVNLLLSDSPNRVQPKFWRKDSEYKASDLTDVDKKRLVEARPSLGDLATVFAVYGGTEDVKKAVLFTMDENDLQYRGPQDTGLWIGDNLIVDEWETLEDAVYAVSTKEGLDFYKYYVQDDAKHRNDDYWPQDISYHIDDLLKSLDPDQLRKIGEYLLKKYPDEAEDLDEEFDPSDASQIEELFKMVEDDELETAMKRAVSTGYETGAEGEAHKIFKRAVDDSPYLYFKGKDGWTREFIWDTEVAFAVPMKELIQHITDDNGYNVSREGWPEVLEAKISPESPYHGLQDYDEEAAAETFGDEADQLVALEDVE